MCLFNRTHFRRIYIQNRKLIQSFVCLYILTFFIILPVMCRNVKHSIYHLQRKSRPAVYRDMKQENDIRLEKSLAALKKNRNLANFLKRSPSPGDLIGITIVTTYRKFPDGFRPRYLTQVAGALLELISLSPSPMNYSINICNVDRNPYQHGEVYDLKQTFKIFQKYDDGFHYVNDTDIYEKEKTDYVFCIEETLKLNASHVLIIEDDAFPNEEMIKVLETILTKERETRGNSMQTVAYWKFYHPERLLGYVSFEVERLAELVSIGVVLGSILTLLCVKFVSSTKKYDTRVVWISWVMYVSFIALTVGRVNVIELRRLTPSLYQLTPAPSCCTQAMLYPADSARSIVKLLRRMRCKEGFGKDIALEYLCKREHFKSLMVQPNLFTHNGIYSTIRKGFVDPYGLN